MSDLQTPEPTVDEALDIQHDPYPAEDHGAARHIPHFGHVALLLGLLALATVLSASGFALLLHGHPQARNSRVAELSLEACLFLLTLGLSIKIFPFVWKRPFFQGIEWNSLAARRNWPRLLGAGVLLCGLAQLTQRFVHVPKNTEVDQVLSSSSGAWGALLLGVFLAPMCEEILFRGFLLPACAIAYDWLSLDRTPAGLERWHNSTAHTVPAQIFAALISSLLFALMHAPQLSYAWGVVGVIFLVGLTLAFVRLKTHSVACSTLVHATYNGTLFALMLIQTQGFRHLDRLHS